MSRTLQLAEQLIALPSVTPNDAGCLKLLAQRLEALGFVNTRWTAARTPSASATCGQNALQRPLNKRNQLLNQ